MLSNNQGESPWPALVFRTSMVTVGWDLRDVCATALLFAIAMPTYQVFQSHYQGQLVHAKRTHGNTEAVAIYVCVALLGLYVGVTWVPSLAEVIKK